MSFRQLLHRLFPFSDRRRRQEELADEIHFHLEMAVEENLARGMDPTEARRQAHLAFGGVEQVKEAFRDQQGLPFVDHLFQDLRFALRSLSRRPVFTLLAVALLGLGIGGSAAVFSVVNAVVLSPLPGAGAERVVFLQETLGAQEVGGNPARLRDWQDRLGSFSAVAGSYGEAPVLLQRGEPRRLHVVRTFGPYLEALGLEPALGRAPTRQEARGAGQPVAVISDRLWRQVFGGGQEVIGGSLALDDSVYTVVGILPPGQFPRDIDAWIPAPPVFQEAPRGSQYLRLTARLGPEVSKEEAQAEL
ncbi:MAG: ABC transporter permease, partial [Acidobacteria bacterium]|nr:ABC transporter permease [Acidobacteriota bacterium]